MTLDKVVTSIREEGRRTAEARLAEARKEADAILEDARREAAAVKEKRAKELAQARESLKLREVAAAELEARKVRLNAEKDVLAKLRREVLDRLGKLPQDRRVAHVKALAQRSNIEGGRVLVAEQDADAARKAGVPVAGTVKALGGVVVVAPDESTREDLTYETILDEAWGSSLNEVARVLFGKAG